MQKIRILDQLPFKRWHYVVISVLGVSWVFDGLEVSSLSLCSASIKSAFGLDTNSFLLISTFYMIGSALGGLTFGVLSYFFGRKQIFIITLSLYALSIILTLVSSTSLPTMMFSRMLAGFSIGGEYTAIFSAVDEFVPAKYRGRAGIIIDGTWHFGGIMASFLSMGLNTVEGWRYLFAIGLVGVIPLFCLRRYIPESPRWLIMKGYQQQAEETLDIIAKTVESNNCLMVDHPMNRTRPAPSNEWNLFFLSFLQSVRRYPRRVLVAGIIIYCQAFFFNSMYYKYPLLLAELGVKDTQVGSYMLPLSFAAFLGPILIGPFFDIVGRRKMCLTTYTYFICVVGLSSILLFVLNWVPRTLPTMQFLMVLLFFVSSPAASSANLTASELFPTNCRGLMLAFMFLLSMAGGMSGVWASHFYIPALVMLIAGLVGFIWGVDAQNKSLEEVAAIQ